MAAHLRPMKGREVLRKLRKAGFEIVRIKGSAHYLKNPGQVDLPQYMSMAMATSRSGH